jgi:hypothetical protein
MPPDRVLARHETAHKRVPARRNQMEVRRFVGQDGAVGMDALDALLKPLIEGRVLKVPSIDTNEVALGWDLSVQAGRRLSDAR